MAEDIRWSLDHSGIGRIVFDLQGEKVNKLSTPVMKQLEKIIETITADPGVKTVLIESAKPGIFIAGADIAEIESLEDTGTAREKARAGQKIFDRLAGLPAVTIAVIDGVCLGGGFELALACDYRVVTDNPKVQVGLPEVSLGIIPGFGGTQRLPRLAGIPTALKLILSGKPVDGKKAWKLGIADEYFSSGFIGEQLAGFISAVNTDRGRKLIERRRLKVQGVTRYLQYISPVREKKMFDAAREDIMKKSGGNYPAPLAALGVIRRTWYGNIQAGLAEEVTEFSKLAVTPVCKNLIRLFHISQDLKKSPGIDSEQPARSVNEAAVVGAGVMGGGIAWLFSKKDIPVRMKDIDWAAIEKGFAQVGKVYGQLKKIRKIRDWESRIKLARVSAGLDYSGFHGKDIVVEAVVENIEIKKKVFVELEEFVRDDCVIASNTSSLSITEMASELKHPGRFIGMHFFNPVNRMPLVEVIPGEKTDAGTIKTVVALAKRLGKTPVVVKNCRGFLVNRILMPYMNEAIYLLVDGADLAVVDRAIKKFGMPMGPFILADEVGIDVCFKVAKILQDSYGERMKVAPLLGDLYEKHHLLGKKGGKGFYLHNQSEKQVNPEVVKTVVEARAAAGVREGGVDIDEIRDRCMLTMVNEAARCLEEEIVSSPEHLDMAMIMGTGFPPFRGGVIRYAEQRGWKEVYDRLRYLAETVNPRFEPSDYIKRCALS